MKKLRNVLMGTLSLTMAFITLTIFNFVSASAMLLHTEDAAEEKGLLWIEIMITSCM